MQKKYFIFISVILLFASCNKSKIWKEPTDVGFGIDIKRTDVIDNRFSFSDGIIIISEFEFEGEREQADDVYFSKSFSGGLTVNFDSVNSVPELDFDIPQGTYTAISVAFDTFDDLGYSNIIINGTYNKTYDNKGTPVRFEFKSGEYFSITAEDDSGDNTIVLDSEIPVTANIILNPVYWFQPVSSFMMEEAETIMINGEKTILINDTLNEEIYDILANRIDESTEAIFEAK